MFDSLCEAPLFSKMHLKIWFHQILVKPEDIEQASFNTKYGQREYLIVPIGLCKAPSTFSFLQTAYACLGLFLGKDELRENPYKVEILKT